MAYRMWSNLDYPFHVPVPSEDCCDYQTYDGLVGSPVYYHRDHEPRNGQDHTMRRYLDEPDRPLFAAYNSNVNGPFISSWPEHPLPPLEYLDSHCNPYDQHRRVASPGSISASGSSSYVSSNLGEAPEVSSWSSPEVAMLDYLPGPVCNTYGYNHLARLKREGSATGGYGSCVALHEVQTHADALPDDSIAFEDDGTAYPGCIGYMDAEEGYQPLETACDHRDMEHNIVVYRSPPKSEDSTPPGSPRRPFPTRYRDTSVSPNIRRRRAPSAVTTSTTSSNRISKRRSIASKYVEEPTTGRAFPCSLAAYGCPSTFGSKNEWKRHINTQHMRLDFWRCDQCPPTRSSSSRVDSKNNSPASGNRKFNDFNRKDLFIQHVRRMHPESILPNLPSFSSTTTAPDKKSSFAPCSKPTSSSRTSSAASLAAQQARAQDAALMAIASRCRFRTRSPPPSSGCLFCSARFTGEDTWDERLEHIGRHFECLRKSNGNSSSTNQAAEEEDNDDDDDDDDNVRVVAEGTNPRRWRRDASVEDWMVEQGILIRGSTGGGGGNLGGRGLVIAA